MRYNLRETFYSLHKNQVIVLPSGTVGERKRTREVYDDLFYNGTTADPV